MNGSLSGPYATFSAADAERARLYRKGVLARVSLRSAGWMVEPYDTVRPVAVSFVAHAA